MLEHKGAHKCTWYQSTLGRRSMIDFVIGSSDLRRHVLDTRVKRVISNSWFRCLLSTECKLKNCHSWGINCQRLPQSQGYREAAGHFGYIRIDSS